MLCSGVHHWTRLTGAFCFSASSISSSLSGTWHGMSSQEASTTTSCRLSDLESP